ncbi:MAG: cytochrome c [Rhodothermales bacterium]|nr:cytochrome c [Rhodothermales bacterium]
MKPLAIVTTTAAVILLAAFSVSDTPLSGAPAAPETIQVDGQEIYLTRCTSCHQMSGEGVPGVFPPLKESEFVGGDKGRLIRVILNGLSGEVVVNGVTYSGMMPPWGSFLDDQQVADVLTYVRTNFGNAADAVTPAEVAAVRSHVKDRKETWTIDELEAEGNHGVPGGD